MRKKKGFTLVELVIVIAVIAILAAVLLPTFAGILERARENTRIQQITSARNELLSGNFISMDELEGYIFTIDERVYKIEKGEVVNVSNDITVEEVMANYSEAYTQPSSSDIVVYLPNNSGNEENGGDNTEESVEVVETLINFELDEENKTAIVCGYQGVPSEELVIPSYIQGIYETKVVRTEYDFIGVGTLVLLHFQDNPDSEEEFVISYNDGESTKKITITKENQEDVLNLRECTDIALEKETTTYCTGKNNYKVVAIKNRCFFGNQTIKHLILPDTVEVIGEEAFYSASGLEKVTLGRGIKKIEDTAFYYARNLQDINFPEGLEIIGNETFNLCSLKASTTIPSTLKILGQDAFGSTNFDCIVEEGNAKYLTSGTNKFFILYDIIDLEQTYFVIHEDTKVIAGKAFCESKITQLEIPNTIVGVGSNAFSSCDNLQKLTLSYIENLANEAFNGISYLKNTYFNGTVEEWCSMNFGKNSHNAAYGANLYFYGEEISSITVPEGTTRIDCQFSGIKNLREVVLPNTIKYIGFYAFSGTLIEKIIIPSSVEYISDFGLGAIDNLKEIVFEHGATDILEIENRLVGDIYEKDIIIVTYLENDLPVNESLKNYNWTNDKLNITFYDIND